MRQRLPILPIPLRAPDPDVSLNYQALFELTFTRGRYDGSYLPEVRYYHQSHPGYTFDPDWKTRAAEQRDAQSDNDDVGPSDIGDSDSEAAAAAAFADSADSADGSNGDTSGDTTTTDAS